MKQSLKKYNYLKKERKKEADSEGVNIYKVLEERKQKYMAYSYGWKEFNSDDEDSSYFDITNRTQSTKLLLTRKFTQDSNSISNEGIKIKKVKTMNSISSKPKREIKEYNEIDHAPRVKKNKNKKVSFRQENFIEYIDVESYKKYNFINNLLFEPDDLNNNCSDVKCTCTIF